MSELKSKDPKDYFPAKFQDLIPDKEITFGICLYFASNSHLMLWRKNGEHLSKDFLKHYHQRGLTNIWIHRDDAEAYELYMNPPEANQPEPEKKAEPEAPEVPPAKPPKTKEAAFINEVVKDPEVTEEQKEVVVKETAAAVVSELASAETPEEQAKVDEKAKEIVKDMLDANPSEASNLIEEVWNLAQLDDELEHSTNVATYAVIFAMAFGKIDPQLLTDLAVAGLMHDVGISRVPFTITAKHFSNLNDQDLGEYQNHLEYSVSTIDQHAPEVTPRAKDILMQHHEKFNGKGYPKGLEGFNFDDIAQIVSMADVVEAMVSGYWDGKPKTFNEAVSRLNKMEKAMSFPEFFNPEVFSTVMRWMKSDRAKAAMEDAENIVESQVKSQIHQGDVDAA